MAEAGITSESKSLKTLLENLLSSARILSANNSVSDILTRLDDIPALQDDIKRSVEQGRRQEEVRQQMLQDYNIDRDKWTSEREVFQKQLVEAQEELAQKQALVQSLESTQHDQARRVKEADALVAVQKQEAEQSRQKIQGLIKALEFERQSTKTLTGELDAEKLKLSHSEASMQQLQKAHTTMSKKADHYSQELNHIAGLTVPLKEESLKIEKIDALWLKLISVVWSWFFKDIKASENQFETFRARLEALGEWSRHVPILITDTQASKFMRCVAITASIARVFDKHLFQPNYLLPSDNAIRDLLARQARVNEEKEASVRASLLAILPDEQAAAASKSIRTACGVILELVRSLLTTSKEQRDFESRLTEVAEEACDIWQEIRCLTDATWSTFDIHHYSNWSWSKLTIQDHHPRIEDLGRFQDSGIDRGVFAILPRFYVWYDGNESPETHGVLFVKSQTIAARDEMEQVTSSPRLERNDSGCGRLARFRRPSTSKKDGQPSGGHESFLESRGSNGSR